MKAVVYERYGKPEVLKLREIPKPAPKTNEVLIRIHATSVTAGDWRMRSANPFLARLFNGLFKPKKVKVLGFELSGVIEQAGSDVKTWARGDEVIAFCGLGFGGYAEYRCLPADSVMVKKPANMTFLQAATVPIGSLTALFLLRRGDIENRRKVLIYGASGSIGTFAVQLAKHFGAHVTGVCSGKNSELVRSIGADETLDYTKERLTALDTRFDLIFDAVGKLKKSRCRRLLAPDGKYVSVKGTTKPLKTDLLFIKELIESDRLTTVIDRTYKLEDIQEAHRYVEQFHKRGNVAIEVV